MAYETGSATTPVDLLNKLRLFCLANSIIVNEFLNDGTGDLLSISFGSGFYSYYYVPADIGIRCLQSTAWNAATAWGSQPNSTNSTFGLGCTTFPVENTSIPVYHFFFYPNGCLFVSFQTAAGVWRQFGCGDIVKYGTYTGGAIILNSNHSTTVTNLDNPLAGAHVVFPLGASSGSTKAYLRVDFPAVNTFYEMKSSAPLAVRGYTNHTHVTDLTEDYYSSTPSAATQATPTKVIKYSIISNLNTAKTIPVGELPDCRIVNMQFFNSGDTYDTNWKVFSIGVKKDPAVRDDTLNTGYFGVALRFQ